MLCLDRVEGLEVLVRVVESPEKYTPRKEKVDKKLPVGERCTFVGLLPNMYPERRDSARNLDLAIKAKSVDLSNKETSPDNKEKKVLVVSI